MKTTLIRIALLALSIFGISLLHYFTPLHLHYLHDIFQRFYYLPVILAAIWFGFRGGMACALAVSRPLVDVKAALKIGRWPFTRCWKNVLAVLICLAGSVELLTAASTDASSFC